MIIDACKHNIDTSRIGGRKLTWEDIEPELASYAFQYKWSNGVPHCPDGGTYTLGRIGEPPKCSVGGPDHKRGQPIAWCTFGIDGYCPVV